ncbi:MAG: hypothetical protein RI932_1528 [Pseudomonadota bacterium]
MLFLRFGCRDFYVTIDITEVFPSNSLSFGRTGGAGAVSLYTVPLSPTQQGEAFPQGGMWIPASQPDCEITSEGESNQEACAGSGKFPLRFLNHFESISVFESLL